MDLGIRKAIDSGNGNAVLFAALLGGILFNTLPTPADSIYFSRVNKLEREFDEGSISAEKLEYHVTGEYYLWTGLVWYGGLFTVLYAMGSEYNTNAKILLAVVAGGLVIGTMQKNIELDKSIQKRKEDAAVKLVINTTNTLLPDNTTVTTNTPPPVFGESTISFPATNETQTIMTVGGSAIGVAAVVHMFSGKPVYSIAAGILGGIGGYFADQQIQNNHKQ